jgi:hypothetical protein
MTMLTKQPVFTSQPVFTKQPVFNQQDQIMWKAILSDNSKRSVPNDLLEVRTIDDFTNVDGVEVIKGDIVGPSVADDEVPQFRDVTLKLGPAHPLRERIVKMFSNYHVLTPLALALEHDSKADLSKKVNGSWFSVPTEKDGEKHIQWMPNSLKSINQAKATFNEYLAQGMVPHRINPANGLAGTEVMRTFDASAGEVMFMDMRAFVAG